MKRITYKHQFFLHAQTHTYVHMHSLSETHTHIYTPDRSKRHDDECYCESGWNGSSVRRGLAAAPDANPDERQEKRPKKLAQCGLNDLLHDCEMINDRLKTWSFDWLIDWLVNNLFIDWLTSDWFVSRDEATLILKDTVCQSVSRKASD